MSQVNVLQTELPLDKYGNQKEWKKQKLDQVREYHAPLIRALGISPLDFNMKMPFYDRHGRYVVGIFGSEFKKDKGFFFELVTRDLDPLESERKVYKISRNDNHEEEYEMNEKGSFLVPVDELRCISTPSTSPAEKPVTKPEEVNTQVLFTSRPEVSDAPYSEMTIRDYIAIRTGKPLSLKPWLNELIQSSKIHF
jgi:hypothetical protein